MPVNLKNIKLARRLTVTYLIFNLLPYLGFDASIATLVVLIAYFILLAFLVKILIFMAERTAVSASLTMYACIEAVLLTNKLWPSGSLADFGQLTVVFAAYMAIQMFRVKNQYLRLPFRLLGVVVFISEVPKLVLLFSLPLAEKTLTSYFAILWLPATAVFLYILKRTGQYLKQVGREHRVTDVEV